MLVGAFYHDPAAIMVSPRDDRRRDHLRVLYGMIVRYSMIRGHICTTSDEHTSGIVGVAVWLPSRHAAPSILNQVKHGLISAIRHCGVSVLLRATKLARFSNSLRVKIMGNSPYWYLWLLGVHPEFQKKGMGTHLLDWELPSLESASAPPSRYVETFTERNLAFYENHGFELVHRQPLSKGLNIYGLRRK